MSAPTVDTDLVERVRQAFADADAEGRPRPGRPTLARELGVTEHQIRQALGALDSELAPAGEPGDASPPADHQAGGDGSPAATSPPPGDHLGDPVKGPDRPAGEELAPVPAIASPAGELTPPAPASPSPAAATVNQPRPWPLIIIGLAAAVAVWGGWVDLGRFTGFGVVQPLPGVWDDLRINTAIVLPLGIEAYGGYALRTWLSSAALSARTRSFARWSAIASLVVGAGAQVASHLMKAANMTAAPPLVTVLVACVPVLVLGLATGLATLVKRDASAGEEK